MHTFCFKTSYALIPQELDANNKEPVPVLIIGNKSDMAHQCRQVPLEMGKKVCFNPFIIINHIRALQVTYAKA